MKQIHNMDTLSREITRLKKNVKEKEIVISSEFDRLVADFEPSKILSKGIKSFFYTGNKNKPILNTALTWGIGMLIEKLLLRKTNFIVRYGLSQVVMNLVSNIAGDSLNPGILQKLRDALTTDKKHNPSADDDVI